MTQEYEKIKESLIKMEKQTSTTILEELIHEQNKPHIFRLLISSGKYINSNSEELLKLAIEKTRCNSKISLEFVKILLFHNEYKIQGTSGFDLNKYVTDDLVHLFFLNKEFRLSPKMIEKMLNDDNIYLFKNFFDDSGEKFLKQAINSKSVKILDYMLTKKDFHAPLENLRNYCEATGNYDMLEKLEKYF